MPVHKDNGSIKSQIPPLSGFFFKCYSFEEQQCVTKEMLVQKYSALGNNYSDITRKFTFIAKVHLQHGRDG